MKYLLLVVYLLVSFDVSNAMPSKKEVYILDRLSVYNPEPKQTDSTPLITACGAKIDTVKLRTGELRWIALSRDFLKKFGGRISYGDSVKIFANDPSIDGSYRVMDTMNKRYKKSADILTHNRKLGLWKNVKMTKL